MGCNYDCNKSSHEFGGNMGIADVDYPLQPDNWQMQPCNRYCRAAFPNCRVAISATPVAMATFF